MSSKDQNKTEEEEFTYGQIMGRPLIRQREVFTDFVRRRLTRSVNDRSTSDRTVSTELKSRIKGLMQLQLSLPDEMQHRDCLIKALTDLCKIITENTVIVGDEIDLLESKNCLTGDDKAHVKSAMGPTLRTRRLLALVLLRDFKTLLVFLESLLFQNTHVVENVLNKFEQNQKSGYRKLLKCTLCLLRNRVDISLFVDDLLSSDDRWLMFYERVSQSDFFGPNADLWNKFVNNASFGDGLHRIADILIKALSSCGFHSDIVRMLQEDKENCVSSFVCRCSGLNHNRNELTRIIDTRLTYTADLQVTTSANKRWNIDTRDDGNVDRENTTIKWHSSKDKDVSTLRRTHSTKLESGQNDETEAKQPQRKYESTQKSILTTKQDTPNTGSIVLFKTPLNEEDSKTAMGKMLTERGCQYALQLRENHHHHHHHHHHHEIKLLKTDMTENDAEEDKTKWLDRSNGGSNTDEQALENLKINWEDEISTETEIRKTSWSYGTNSAGSFNLTNGQKQHKIEQLEPDVSEKQKEDGGIEEHRMEELKDPLENDNENDSGCSFQSLENTDSDDSAVGWETVDEEVEENYKLAGHGSSSSTNRDYAVRRSHISAKRPREVFEQEFSLFSSEAYSQTRNHSQNKEVAIQSSPEKSKMGVQWSPQTNNETRNALLNFLIITALCYFLQVICEYFMYK